MNRYIAFRAPEALFSALHAVAEHNRVSVSEIIRRAIDQVVVRPADPGPPPARA